MEKKKKKITKLLGYCSMSITQLSEYCKQNNKALVVHRGILSGVMNDP